MMTIQSILAFVLVVIQLCVGILNLVKVIQSIIYGHRRELREQKQDVFDLEYHNEQIKRLDKYLKEETIWETIIFHMVSLLIL